MSTARNSTQLSSVVAPQEDWRPRIRSVVLGAAVLLGIVWTGLLVVAALTYHLMSRIAAVALTWDLGRWNTWGFTGRGGNHAAEMRVAGIWWILVPLIALVAASVAARLRPRPAEPPDAARQEG